MADNYLDYHREEYEKRKAKWMAKHNKKSLIFASPAKKK
jgi:hypothetical protein